jgi:GNAT superfamily N-acetyltransferase
MKTNTMTNANGTPVLTELTAGHLQQAVALSSEMGWPYRLEDWAFAHRLGKGFALEQAGRLIGTALHWEYGDAWSSVGMAIVAKAFQGCGYGTFLVDTVLEDVGTRNVFLNATPDAFELYRRRGFHFTATLNQHQGVPAPGGPDVHPDTVRIADTDDLPRILALDHDAVGMPRTALLRLLAQTGKILEMSDGAVASGYAVYREFGRGYVIGPVVAPSLENACVLVDAAISRLPGEFVRVDTSEDSGLTPWLEARGLPRVDSASTMVRGTLPPPTGQARLFALCSQSLG